MWGKYYMLLHNFVNKMPDFTYDLQMNTHSYVRFKVWIMVLPNRILNKHELCWGCVQPGVPWFKTDFDSVNWYQYIKCVIYYWFLNISNIRNINTK